jgi:two-component system response regulator LytT
LRSFRGQKITSDYNALDEVESSLIHAPFFRLNRQYLVHRDAIRRIAEAENRKFDVTIQPNGKSEEQFSVPVSRYRARDFKNWFYRSEPAFN